MNGVSGGFRLFQFFNVVLAVVGRNGIFIFCKFEQFAQCIALCWQAKHPAVDVFIAFPAVEMTLVWLKPFHAIGVRVGPNRVLGLRQHPVAKDV